MVPMSGYLWTGTPEVGTISAHDESIRVISRICISFGDLTYSRIYTYYIISLLCKSRNGHAYCSSLDRNLHIFSRSSLKGVQYPL
jgi:hypothetical protein